MMKHFLLVFTSLTLISVNNYAQTVTDIDSNTYTTIVIGTQTWMQENLKVSRYTNGNLIPNITVNGTWDTLTTPARCYYDNDSLSYDSVYGAIYNWYAIDDTNHLCPAGWHVPSDSDWLTVASYPGYYGMLSPTFGGGRSAAGTFNSIGLLSRFWTSTGLSTLTAQGRYFASGGGGVTVQAYYKDAGVYVRCIKDTITTNIYDELNNLNIRIFPNPACDKLTISGVQSKNIKVQIINQLGNIVLQSELRESNNNVEISLLPKGIYIIRISQPEFTIQRKFAKL